VDGVNAIKQKSIVCHYCPKVVLVGTSLHIQDQALSHFPPDLINSIGTGYLQGSFSVKCPNSHIFNTITKETLAVRKLAFDLAGPPALGLS
jgi:phage FluMu protein Com